MASKLETVTMHTFVLSEEETFTIIDALYEYGDNALADELSGLIEDGVEDVKYEETPHRIDSLEAFDELMKALLGDNK